MRLFGKPYRDAPGSVHFPGLIWMLLFIVPWIIGVVQIVRWL